MVLVSLGCHSYYLCYLSYHLELPYNITTNTLPIQCVFITRQWFGYNGSMNDKAKNIAQTEMLEDLRSNIAAIVKHFGGDTRLDVSPDYSFESHQRDMDSFKEFTRNRYVVNLRAFWYTFFLAAFLEHAIW